MINLKSSKKDYYLSIPENLNEINESVLNTLTDPLNLAPNYCAIALVYRIKLFDLITATDDKLVNVVPIIAKISDEDSKKINAKVGERCLINKYDIERAYHYNSVNNSISINNVLSFIKDDKELMTSITTGNYLKNNNLNNSLSIHLIELKVIPINSIAASFDLNSKVKDIFKHYNTNA